MRLNRVRVSDIRNMFCVVVMVAVVALNRSDAQGQSYPYYYVVVGGFASQSNAAHFAAHVQALNYPARYAFNTNRKLYYVYVRVTKDKQQARETTYRLRLEKEFKKAWIYNGPLEGSGVAESTAEAEREEAHDTGNNVISDAHQAFDTTAVGNGAATDTLAAATSTVPVKTFVFVLTTGKANTPVAGSIHLLDKEPDDRVEQYPANEKIFVSAPATGKLVVVCNLIGYKLAKRTINFADPLKSIKGASVGEEREVIVPIKLVPVNRGDYLELEHIKFFEHSAVLTPASESELLELVNFMANPRCKIRLFGHTQSDAAGEIITKGASTNFFALDPANNRSTHGSAAELSRQQAEIVKAYLVSKGVAAGRIATKGYGATLAIYENAAANDRIEVEIIRN
jgi:outer membrane protein OmpA-like peptidoglycan-associated protein